MTAVFKTAYLACRHYRRLRNALGTWTSLWSGDGYFDALGGLTQPEIDGLVGWIREAIAASGKPAAEFVVVEVGTLFGFTAKAIAERTGAKVRAIDNFSWNPFGMPGEAHARFTRSVLSGTAVELVEASAEPKFYRGADFVFLDGDHTYGAVRREIAEVRAAGVRLLSGHDYANGRFGVTRAVDEAFGRPDATAGLCWLKRC